MSSATQKIINSNPQPQGGEGIVSVAGARGLAAADKLRSNNTVSPFPPLLASEIDNTNAVTNNVLSYRFNSDEVRMTLRGIAKHGGKIEVQKEEAAIGEGTAKTPNLTFNLSEGEISKAVQTPQLDFLAASSVVFQYSAISFQ